MSPRLFPEMDGASRNTDWLIHRLTECAAAVTLLSCSFPGQNIQPDTLERMTNEWGCCRHCSRLSACVCVCAATGVPVDRLGYFYESTPNMRPQVSDEWVNRIGNGSLFHPPPLAKDCARTLLWQRAKRWRTATFFTADQRDHNALVKAVHASLTLQAARFLKRELGGVGLYHLHSSCRRCRLATLRVRAYSLQAWESVFQNVSSFF